ncbi:HesA/MoeB/ThiF family protein [Demequina sp.]|uniref:HesA/MoeB/ThiF family protein n=1 Tax=Demequina sp. TaxID=2050685 RepID=UPI003D09D8A5
MVQVASDRDHFLGSADVRRNGMWFAADESVHVLAYFAVRQHRAVPLEEFRRLLPGVRDPGNKPYVALTYVAHPPEFAPGRRLPKFFAWTVARHGVEVMACDVEQGGASITALEPHWPTGELASRRVLVVGAGSIGGATAQALAGYGIGHIDLLDPDRLRDHNVPRHVCTRNQVGMHKVNALARLISRTWPETTVQPWVASVIEDADLARPLIDAADIVVCTVDGVEPRRVVNYLGQRASTTVVFACVLEDGRYGEVLRVRPLSGVGCLDCQRQALEEGGAMNPEPGLDHGYGEGTRHNPMTAVGPDLHFVGALAAKVAIADLLAGPNHVDQFLVSDNVVVSLRPQPGMARPFDSSRVLGASWYPAAKPSSDCPACGVRA